MKSESGLLKFGIVVPVIYFGTLILVPLLLYPGYSHRTQYASELGAAAAPHPAVFNFAIVAAGLSAILGGIGIAVALRRIYGSKVAGTLAGVAISLWGVAIVMAGLFPMPNELHNAFGLAMILQLAPLFALIAVWKAEDVAWLKWLLAVVFLVSGGLFAIMMGIGGMVRVADVGYWQRAYAVSSILWVGVLALALHSRLRAAPPASA
jgi:hypothetical membrane protein